MRRGWWSALCAALACVACRVAPHSPESVDPLGLGGSRGVRSELVAAPQLRITRLSVNGRELSQRSWERVLARVEREITGEIVLDDAAPLELPARGDGALAAPFEWPTHGAEELLLGSVVRRELVPGTWFEYARGAEVIALESATQEGAFVRKPVVEPQRVLVAIVPLDPASPELLGLHERLMRLEGGAVRDSGSLIVIQADALAARSNWFVSRRQVEEHVLMHEFAHALGVPVEPKRTWRGPHRGAHCTRPECVLYPALDWRSLLSGIFHGVPLELCDACRGELAQARGAAATRAGSTSSP